MSAEQLTKLRVQRRFGAGLLSWLTRVFLTIGEAVEQLLPFRFELGGSEAEAGVAEWLEWTHLEVGVCRAFVELDGLLRSFVDLEARVAVLVYGWLLAESDHHRTEDWQQVLSLLMVGAQKDFEAGQRNFLEWFQQ